MSSESSPSACIHTDFRYSEKNEGDLRPRDSQRFWNELQIQRCRTLRDKPNGMIMYCLRELLEEPVSDELAAFQDRAVLEAVLGREGRGQGVI